MNVETRTLVRSSLDASGYTRGAQQVATANEQIAASGEKVAVATERTTIKMRESGGAIEQLQRSLDPAYGAMQRLERAQNSINAAMERGAITQQRATQLITLAQQRYAVAGTAVGAFAVANDNAGRSTGRFGAVAQQAGYQVQDLATQIAMGQNALVAFGTQFAQFAGFFGATGAIAGAVVIVGVLAARLLSLGSAADDAKKAQERLAGAVQTLNELMETQAERAARLEREQRGSAVSALSEGFARQARVVAEERKALDALNAEMRAAQEANRQVPGFDADRIFAQRLQERRTAVATAERELLELDRQIERARTAPSGADRDKAEREAREARERAEREAEQERLRRERQGETAARTAARREETEERREREREEREATRFRETQEREELQRLNRIDEANRRTTDSIVNYGSEAFAGMFEQNENGWRGMLDGFLSTFRRIMARMAAEAVIRPIISPIVSSLGLGSIGSTGGAGGGGGLGSLAGGGAGGGLLSGAGNMLGLSSLLPAGGLSLTGLGVASGLFGNGVPVLAGANGMLAGGGAASSGAVSTAGLFGTTTLGATLGVAGLGFMGGSMLAGLTGGSQMGGGIGGGLGAAAGFLVGGPVGALIGGAAGGALGGMFGGKDNPPFYHVELGAQDGRLSVGGAAGKRAGEEMTQALAQAQQQVAQLNTLLDSLGLSVTGSTLIGRDQADPNRPADLAAAFSRFRFSGGSETLNATLQNRSIGSPEELAGIADFVKLYEAAIATSKPVSAFTAAIEGINAQFDAAATRARELGLSEQALNDAREKAVAAAYAARQETLIGIRETLKIRDLAASGFDRQAQLRAFDFAAEQEVTALRSQLEALGVSANNTARFIEDLTNVQAKERDILARAREEEKARAAAEQRETLRALGANINEFLGRLGTTDAGGFSPTVQLANARAAFDASLERARLNDPDALRRITGDADALLGSARDVYASGRGFSALRDYVIGALGGLDAAELARASSTSSTAFDPGSMAALDALRSSNEELQDRFDRLIEIMEGIEATNARMAYATPPAPVGARA